MKQLLQECASKANTWVELRYHERRGNRFTARNGRIDDADSVVKAGIGVRAMVDGAYGFACTDELTAQEINRAIEKAIANARSLARLSNKVKPGLPAAVLAKLDAIHPGYDSLIKMSQKDKIDRIVGLERQSNAASERIVMSTVRYAEIFEHKILANSEGALAEIKYSIPSLALSVVAERDGERSSYQNSFSVRGDWNDMFAHFRAEGMVEKTCGLAVDLLDAPHPEGGKHTVILEPGVVGLLSHEAIGHTVEADAVLGGSVASGKVGKKVASELVTLCDSGSSPYDTNAVGTLEFDDEGIPCKTVKIIEDGIFKAYLHDRETAAIFGVEPTGNARAWLYHDEPLIRMRNTYIEPGTQTLDEIIDSTENGYLLEGCGSGQADSTGEFMFGIRHATEIKKGKLGKIFKEVTISGVAFDVLKTVDAVSSEFRWDCGAGHCGKGQPAKIDAGGPYLRCKATLGGGVQ